MHQRMGLGMRPAQGPPIGTLSSQPPPFALPPSNIGRTATLFVGSISAGIEDGFLNRLLGTCGPPSKVLARMITPAGKPQGFGFVEYPDPVSASRAVRLLNGLELPTFEDGTVIKTLLVKPDEKTRMFLDTESGGGVDDEQAQKEIEVLMEEIREQSKKFAEGGHLDKEKYVIPPHLHDLQEKDLPDAQRGLITSQIAQFRERSAKKEREKVRDVMAAASTFSAPSGPRAQQQQQQQQQQSRPVGNDTPQSYTSSQPSFVKSNQKTDLELEEERVAQRRSEENRSFLDRERRYEQRERSRITSIERSIAREKVLNAAQEKDREEMRRRLDVWDDDESDELFYVERARWRIIRARHRDGEEERDAKGKREEGREREELEKESAAFLEKQMAEMQEMADEQRKAGLLLDDGAPVKLSVALGSTAAPATEAKKRVFDDHDEEEEALGRKRKTQLQKLDFSVSESVDKERTRQRLEELRAKVPTDKDTLFRSTVRWDAVSENMIDRKFEPLIRKLLTKYIGADDDDLVLFACEHLKDRKNAARLVEGVEMVLEEDSEAFGVSVWRQVVFEGLCYSEGVISGSMYVD